MTIFTPKTEEDVLETVQWALSREVPMEIIGHGTKRAIGRPMQVEHTIDLSGLSGVTLYEPEELVLSAKAGTPLAEIEALLGKHGQCLQFEPMDYGPLLKQVQEKCEGSEPGRGTIGGVLAANLSGPRRLKAGAARDHILGVRAVSGRGELFKSGGRVVKNVTGYDLSKGMAGSWGTLGVFAEVTFKVLPAPETETTLALRGLEDEEAARAMAIAMGSSAEVSSAAHLPVTVTGKVVGGALSGKASTLLRLEGFAPSVEARAERLKALLKPAGELDEIAEDQSRRLWQEIRDCLPFADNTQRCIWRVSMAPMEAHKMVYALRLGAGVDAFYDWQGGLVWLRMEADPEPQALRRLIAHFGGGHATLVRAPAVTRGTVDVFEPQPPSLAALSQRLKQQFDPKGILNRGRMLA
ncbi:glycolate oxidase subunit GlcE [Brucella sp. IR073]|uniref:glycolate oxidase subunit GlcE n=1 Tax=unclassified Brucella TaxID=2632610 RepID=UPI003B97DA75